METDRMAAAKMKKKTAAATVAITSFIDHFMIERIKYIDKF